MKKNHFSISFILLLFLITGCQKNLNNPSEKLNSNLEANENSTKVPQSLKDFHQVNLISDLADFNPARVDTRLNNAWGLSSSPTGIIWISSSGGGNSFVVNKEGVQAIAPVNIPSPSDLTGGGQPTGQVFNSSTGFKLPNGNAARFIFAGAEGTISGWNGGTTAIRKINKSPNSFYSGLAIATDAGNTFLYAADFAQGKIDVFDTGWNEVSKPFWDANLPAGYSPFNIQAIGNQLYVMYAKVGPDGDEVHSPGTGVVDIYNTDGSLNKRLVTNGQLNAPWGVAKAPKSFWGSEFDNTPGDAILIGNFGDGRINAYSSEGTFLGQLRAHGEPIVIDGLWGIMFAPSTATTVDPNRLYFAAGPADETHGLFGYIIK